jgi:hypothetical protein
MTLRTSHCGRYPEQRVRSRYVRPAPRGVPAVLGLRPRTPGAAGGHTSSAIAAGQPLWAGERFLELMVSKPDGETDVNRLVPPANPARCAAASRPSRTSLSASAPRSGPWRRNCWTPAATARRCPATPEHRDTLRVSSTHDATLRRLLPALGKLRPRYVVWGDGSCDEMCLGLLIVTIGTP